MCTCSRTHIHQITRRIKLGCCVNLVQVDTGLAADKKCFILPILPGNHVVAGDIMAPQNNALVSDYVVSFIQDAENAAE